VRCLVSCLIQQAGEELYTLRAGWRFQLLQENGHDRGRATAVLAASIATSHGATHSQRGAWVCGGPNAHGLQAKHGAFDI